MEINYFYKILEMKLNKFKLLTIFIIGALSLSSMKNKKNLKHKDNNLSNKDPNEHKDNFNDLNVICLQNNFFFFQNLKFVF
jgi:hypothetical protein